ncbi:hypothetical protein [Microbacterium luticocti]|uniref:hypothetical protein n=1 Tax=Microbacterium luticocti TaxID=451764 RepID=UPI000414125E|nr:hypothetical protein [Microbacterium luticocti]
MVATVLRLRYRILANTLTRSPWRLVGFCFGVLGALWMLGLAALAVVALVIGGVPAARIALPLAGGVLVLGWLLGPLVVAGADTTIDTVRLAPFPIGERDLMRALFTVSLGGIPGIATTIVALLAAGAWLPHPLAVVAAVPLHLIGVGTCVLAGRLGVDVFGGLGGSRRAREVIGTVTLVLVAMTGPIIIGIGALIGNVARGPAAFAAAAEIVGWTPFGAAWSAAGDIAGGAVLPAVGKTLVAVATPALLWLLWRRALRTGVGAGPRPTSRTVAPGRTGLFGIAPTGPVGATWARSLTAWTRDPRYLRQLVFVPVFPVLFLIAGGGVDGTPFGMSAVLVALVLAIAGYADVSYDGTAFATVLGSGIRGWADRVGRMLGAACIGVPAVILVALVTTGLAGAWSRLPAVLGAGLGLVLVGYGVSAVSSALIVVPVAAPGDNPFRSVPGQTFLSGMLVFVVLAACLLLASPALVIAVIAAGTGSAGLGLLAATVGLGTGAIVIVAGVIAGGRIFDRNAPALLAQIRAFPTS